MTTHNGWTNYATWRVHLELFDGSTMYGPVDLIANECKEIAEGIVCSSSVDNSIAQDYALAFLSDVNWTEIAEHLIEAVEA